VKAASISAWKAGKKDLERFQVTVPPEVPKLEVVPHLAPSRAYSTAIVFLILCLDGSLAR
jgi:hypothetical protein